MAFTEPMTFSAGAVLTASQMNTYVRDNVDFLSEPPRALAYHNTTQSISTATETIMACNSEEYDSDTMHDPSTNNERLTASTAGTYLLNGACAFASGYTGRFFIYLKSTGGGGHTAILDHHCSAGGSQPQGMVGGTIALAAAEYAWISVYQESGGALNITSGATNRAGASIAATWIGE